MGYRRDQDVWLSIDRVWSVIVGVLVLVLALTVCGAATTTAEAHTGWTPASECRKIRNPGPVYLTRDTLGWCGKIAYYLDLGERKDLWVWRPGDLHRVLLMMECESNGRIRDNLFQFIWSTWNTEAPRAARQLGFDNPTRSMPYDNIAAAVWLYKTDGPGHWANCSGLSTSTATGRAVRATLVRMGYAPPTKAWW